MLSKNKQTSNKFIGVWISEEIHNQLVLYTIANNENKSNLVRFALEEWVGKNIVSRDELIYEILNRLQKQLEIAKIMDPTVTVDQFKEGILNELLKKGLNKIIAKSITDNIG
mgnify:CR=1 FL=1